MSFAILQLIVLGKIPGTNLTIGFWELFGIVFAVALLLFYGKMLHITARILRKIDPFRGAPKDLNYFDLTAL